MAEVLEVQPVSWRVVSLNAPHLKSLCVFEALSRALGCCYNHHRPQVVWCEASVRLPAPRITRVRGHTSHTLAPGHTPTLTTTIKMGTYLVFHLADWRQVHHCHLVIHGIEKVPKSHTLTQVILERVDTAAAAAAATTTPLATQGKADVTNNTLLVNSASIPEQDSCHHHNPHRSGAQEPPFLASTHIRAQHTNSLNLLPPCSLDQPHHREVERQLTEPSLITTGLAHDRDQGKDSAGTRWVAVNMGETEEVITLLDDDDDDDGCESDASDDLHKVVARRVSVDMTSLLTPPPSDQVLVLLLRPDLPHSPPDSPCSPPASHAWQFQSTCIKVSLSSSRGMVREGSGTLKKALTRTKPLYFSKNGNAHRL